ncbi:MAG: transglutaminase-like domain-containing protein [Clostridiales Family XIII bacterium]|nr:transglutaminase-like domain-containing protein [Clostridiales Family XIII bacterium]
MRVSLCRIWPAFMVIVAVMALSSCEKMNGAIDGIANVIEGGGSSVEENPDAPDRDNAPKVLVCEAPGTETFGGNGCTVDFSHANDGYVMVKYEGDNPKVKVRITFAGGDPYTYDLKTNAGFEAFPLSLGSGAYEVGVFTNVDGDKYAQAAQQTVAAEMPDEFSPFLRPNQYIFYTAEHNAVAKAQEVCAGVKSDLGATERIFLYVVENISYDFEKAATVQSGYVPNVDETLSSETGICFDYASLTSAMLRSQGIPCKLIIGYAGSAYHAWIKVFSKETGEVASMIEFHGGEWARMDPTFAAGGSKTDPNVVGDGANYNPLYEY